MMAEILERGDIYFLYRPRVDEDDPSGLEDVQRLLVVLQPRPGERVRVLIVGRKVMPKVIDGVQERHWAFVAGVLSSPDELHTELNREVYTTAAGARREQPAARPVGEGVYGLVRHGDHTHLAYRLELPAQPGEAQAELGIAPEASYVLAVRNPDVPSPVRRSDRPPAYPAELRERFGGRRWVPVDPAEFLDTEGAELVLISAGTDVEDELGVRLDAAAESAGTAEILAELPLEADRPLAPLLRGEWG